MGLSHLELVRQVDSSPHLVHKDVYFFKSHDGLTLGKMLPFVVDALAGEQLEINASDRTVTMVSLENERERTGFMKRLCDKLRESKRFSVLEGWRNELYPVYSPSRQLYFLIERSAACLFGLVTYGSHITGYVPAPSPQDYRLWVPRRSWTKPTYPGALDNTVAGGLGYPHGPLQTSIKESQEEAGLSADYVENHIVAVGVVTYEFQAQSDLDSEKGVFQPEVEYVYDLVLEEGVVPKPEDGEVDEFMEMSLPEVQSHLAAGDFKYNCALVLVDFLIRHGVITPENEPDYIEIVEHCHRALPYPRR